MNPKIKQNLVGKIFRLSLREKFYLNNLRICWSSEYINRGDFVLILEILPGCGVFYSCKFVFKFLVLTGKHKGKIGYEDVAFLKKETKAFEKYNKSLKLF